jgi:prepilin-type N-terminal cleavage/methylation domain-containing protein
MKTHVLVLERNSKMRKLLPRIKDNEERSLGFTLIELLVVVGIITLLMAILSTVLIRARANAKRIKCGFNLGQIAKAWLMYLEDYDLRFYKHENANHCYGGWKGERIGGDKLWPWPRPLNPYVELRDPKSVTERSAKIFLCPADRGGIPGPYKHRKAYIINGTSYQTNPFLIGQHVEWNSCGDTTEDFDTVADAFVRESRLNDVDLPHTEVLLIGDEGWRRQWTFNKPPDWPKFKRRGEWHRKSECYNMAFLDTHVVYLRIESGVYRIQGEWSVVPSKKLSDSLSYPLIK